MKRELTHYGKPVTYITADACTDEKKNILDIMDLKEAISLPILSVEYTFFKMGEDFILLNDLDEAFVFNEMPEDLDFKALISDVRGQAHGHEPITMISKLCKLHHEAKDAVWDARTEEEKWMITCGKEDEQDTLNKEAAYIWNKYHYWKQYIEILAAKDTFMYEDFKNEFVKAYKEIAYV